MVDEDAPLLNVRMPKQRVDAIELLGIVTRRRESEMMACAVRIHLADQRQRKAIQAFLRAVFGAGQEPEVARNERCG